MSRRLSLIIPPAVAHPGACRLCGLESASGEWPCRRRHVAPERQRCCIRPRGGSGCAGARQLGREHCGCHVVLAGRRVVRRGKRVRRIPARERRRWSSRRGPRHRGAGHGLGKSGCGRGLHRRLRTDRVLVRTERGPHHSGAVDGQPVDRPRGHSSYSIIELSGDVDLDDPIAQYVGNRRGTGTGYSLSLPSAPASDSLCRRRLPMGRRSPRSRPAAGARCRAVTTLTWRHRELRTSSSTTPPRNPPGRAGRQPRPGEVW